MRYRDYISKTDSYDSTKADFPDPDRVRIRKLRESGVRYRTVIRIRIFYSSWVDFYGSGRGMDPLLYETGNEVPTVIRS
jgi:hypothetical protein